MFLENSLFKFYRIFLRVPNIIIAILLILMTCIIISQIIYSLQIVKKIDFSQILINYTKSKSKSSYQHKQLNISNNSSVINYSLLDDSTILHFQMRNASQFTIQQNHTFLSNKSQIPSLALMKNQLLAFVKNKSQPYLQKHNITYDIITFPIIQIQQPLFTYYFTKQTQINQILLNSFIHSFPLYQSKMVDQISRSNNTIVFQHMTELYLYLYFHRNKHLYSATINLLQLIYKTTIPSFITKTVYSVGILTTLIISSVIIGLLIRFIIISILTTLLIITDRFIRVSQGWVHQYLNILRVRQGTLTLKIMFFYIAANIFMPLLLALGAYCILTKIIYPSIPLSEMYLPLFVKTIFLIELFHYIFSRSRTTIKFLPIISCLVNYLILLLCSLQKYPIKMMLLNINISIHIIIFLFFILIQKLIVQQNQKGLIGTYCPSISKPRLLFYAGYDINWQITLPPMFTYFTPWFDYSHFNQSQKCLIQRDYQLLYGRMLGLNQRQQIPQEDYQLREVQQPHFDQPSNEVNLIQS